MQDHNMQIKWSLPASGWWVTSAQSLPPPEVICLWLLWNQSFPSVFPTSQSLILCWEVISDCKVLFKLFSSYSCVVPCNSSVWCLCFYIGLNSNCWSQCFPCQNCPGSAAMFSSFLLYFSCSFNALFALCLLNPIEKGDIVLFFFFPSSSAYGTR